MSESQSLCFTCSQTVGDPPRLNRLENGLPCPTCRDRILAYLPPALPGPGSSAYQRPEPPAVSDEATGKLGALYSVDFGDSDEPA
jgi:DNA-directed RNA polymerase subunit RPC12/RpoP